MAAPGSRGPFLHGLFQRKRPLGAVVVLGDLAFNNVEERVDVLRSGHEELLALVDAHATEKDVHGLFIEPVAYD